MAADKTFHCEIVTPESLVMSADVRFVALPAHDGEVGILSRRAPLLVRLGIGELRYETGEGKRSLFIDGGFAEMSNNRLTVLTTQAHPPEDLDHETAMEMLATAETMQASDDVSFVARQYALQRARSQIKLSQR